MSRRSTLSRRSSQKGSISVKASSSTNGVIATLTSSLADLNTLLDSLRAENAQLKEENKKHLVKEEETLTELQQLRINNTKLRTLYPDNPIDHPSDSEEEQNAPTNAAADAYKLIENDAEHWRARLDEANVRILALTAQHPQFLQSIDRLQRREVRLKQELATVPDLVRKDKETIEQMQLQISFLNEGILTLKAKLKTHETECPELRALWNRYMESTTHGRDRKSVV